MDSVTQGLLGAAVGEALLGKKIGYKAALTGAIIATIPDLDIILYPFYTKLEMLSIHLGFSHSIIFSLLGAFFIAFILSKIKWSRDISFTILALFSWLSLFTHILLDTFTAYGTQLLLPFSDKRMGFDSVNVIDPVYTIPLLIGLTLSVWLYRSSSKRSFFNYFGIIISSLYLLFTLVNKEAVKAEISNKFSSENIEYHSLLTMPVGIANIHWYGVAKGADSIYMIKLNMLSNQMDPIEAFAINEEYLYSLDDKLAEKMRWFAKGFYTVEKVNDKVRIYNLQVDMRGIVHYGNKKSPTKGYFEISNNNGEAELTSGTLNDQ